LLRNRQKRRVHFHSFFTSAREIVSSDRAYVVCAVRVSRALGSDAAGRGGNESFLARAGDQLEKTRDASTARCLSCVVANQLPTSPAGKKTSSTANISGF